MLFPNTRTFHRPAPRPTASRPRLAVLGIVPCCFFSTTIPLPPRGRSALPTPYLTKKIHSKPPGLARPLLHPRRAGLNPSDGLSSRFPTPQPPSPPLRSYSLFFSIRIPAPHLLRLLPQNPAPLRLCTTCPRFSGGCVSLFSSQISPPLRPCTLASLRFLPSSSGGRG